MIEIAISLAIIGFALVAIIGILPLGMTAQRDNRHETIINQDASVLMDAVRNGERGLDDLTNYVIGITNYETDYSGRNATGNGGRPIIWGYTPTVTTLNGGTAPQQYPLTNGYTIIGLLSTPKIILAPNGGYYSNHVVGVFRSLSGPASEKPPQRNPTMQEMALTYKVVADVSGYGTNFFDPTWVKYANTTNDPRYNYFLVVSNFQNNLRDVRLTFLWPLLPNGKLGDGRQVYRTMVAGSIINEPTNNIIRNSPFWFFQPRTYF